MARDATFDLGTALARPGFTPAARDAPALVELIVRGDEPAATRAAPALASLRDTGRKAVEARLARTGDGGARGDGSEGGERRKRGDRAERRATRAADSASSVDEGARAAGVNEGANARLVGVLGLLARAGDDHARTAVIAHASDAAPRVRRAAVVALGKLGGDDARQVLLARWDAGDATPDERRALAEALGKVGGDDALARLRALETGDDAELLRRRDRAVLMADRSAKRDTESQIAVDTAPPAPVTIQLGCRAGLGGLLLEELAALGLVPRTIAARGAQQPGEPRETELRLAAPLGSLFASRLWATIGVPIRLAPASDLAASITQTIIAPSTRALLRAWTRGPIRWRLGFAHGHKRAIVWRVARDVTAAAPELINDPTATTWDVLIDDEAGSLALVPRRLDDPRFAYRVADVPAASHPTVAA
ncbi:MAG TPA: HEAT repeat domain-containing protein, partial [Kofleriaceae bacterium]|nr:HEAT repeat domain-containing protein [Kofleriaceae bacterium]